MKAKSDQTALPLFNATSPRTTGEGIDDLPVNDSHKSFNSGGDYTAADIEILEGLEPVRRRPGMYIGGVDAKAMHHLFTEAIDNAMDEAINGHASVIKVRLDADGYVSVSDNGRGIPVDPHPKMPDKTALEVIMTTLHSGGKFDSNAYNTAGGLHGVGISVVNALAEDVVVEVTRDQTLYRQRFCRGQVMSALEVVGKRHNQRGTKITFKPDRQIFGSDAKFDAARLFAMSRSKAYLFAGVEVRWQCDDNINAHVPSQATFYFVDGLKDLLTAKCKGYTIIDDGIFAGKSGVPGQDEAVEWAIAFTDANNGFIESYCNTIPTSEGGNHELGLKMALLRGMRSYAELSGNKRAQTIVSEDIIKSCISVISLFITEPSFSGQTKARLASSRASGIVENNIRDAFEHWLSAAPARGEAILDACLANADQRLKAKREREISRKTAIGRLRLPGKLADCSRNSNIGTELFIVEGDSAGGSAKTARDRQTQAILPLRGKILNVVSAGDNKMLQNQQLSDLLQALGCGVGNSYQRDNLRYERIIIMTDADVDGAHIASLLISFFFTAIPNLIIDGHLYLAVPPLYRLSDGNKTIYAKDDAHRDELMASVFKNKAKVEISRFKGLGEMLPNQLKTTTMDPNKRTLLKVEVTDEDLTKQIVEQLLGNRADGRLRFIEENAPHINEIII